MQGIHILSMSFFETSALLITFISLGKYLESHAKGRTSQARPHALSDGLSCRLCEPVRCMLRTCARKCCLNVLSPNLTLPATQTLRCFVKLPMGLFCTLSD